MADPSPLPAVAAGATPAGPAAGVSTAPPWSARSSLPVRSAGMLAWVPPGRAFRDSGRLAHLHAAVALAATAALAVLFVLYAALQAEPGFLALAAPAALAAAAGGAVVERRLLRVPGTAVAPGEHPARDGSDVAVEAALAARRRRVAARRLAERDPALARDLRVGRPDLPSDYDDGGLVDVNSAPAPVLLAELGLTEEETGRVLRVREHVGGFRSPDDLVALAGLGQRRLDRVADRLIALP